MANFPVTYTTRLVVGSELSAGITKVQTKPYDFSLLGGLSVLNGPVVMGTGLPLAAAPLGTAMIGITPPTAGTPSVAGLHVLHPLIGMNVFGPIAANFYGTVNTFGFKNNFGSNLTFGIKQTLGLLNKIGLGVEVGGTVKAEPINVEAAPAKVVAAPVTNIAGSLILTGVGDVASAIQSKKSFDIPHPTKEGWRLRHICLEGPSAEVYVRGVLKNSNTIELPDYWKGLVDPESITVNLTPIGTHQELCYEIGEWASTIKVMNSGGGHIHCSYIIYAERKDTERNIPEYKGLTPADYPGDNNEYTINDNK
tara:strand:+ start:176 stop:1102 length:927 start_codon:yes stop_codon:yes gene_type:complete